MYFLFYEQQSSNACLWSIYIQINMLFQSLHLTRKLLKQWLQKLVILPKILCIQIQAGWISDTDGNVVYQFSQEKSHPIFRVLKSSNETYHWNCTITWADGGSYMIDWLFWNDIVCLDFFVGFLWRFLWMWTSLCGFWSFFMSL